MTNTTAYLIKEQPDTFWAYSAGYLDGEGSISICQNGPRLIIANTHLITLEELQDGMGFGSIREVGKKNLNRTKPCYNLCAGSNGLRALLPKLLPYLREKKELAVRMLAYLETTTPQTAGLQGPQYYEKREQAKEYFMQEVGRRKLKTINNEAER